jgi:hypothetical protein
MFYGYDGPEYADYGGYDDYNGYDGSYSDHAEPVYNDPDPTPSEPYHHEEYGDVQYHDDANYGDETDRREAEYEIQEGYEHERPEYEGSGEYEREGDNRDTGYAPYEPRGFGHGDDGAYEHEGPVYHNARTADRACAPPQLAYHKELGEYVHPCFLPPIPTPRAPTPRGRDPLCASQRGHVTASNHAQAAR